MTPRSGLSKTVDLLAPVRCATGSGLLREEVWEDAAGNVVRYNLAFINHFLTSKDNGRVLGYDNSHGAHHRHYKGSVELIAFPGYKALAKRFVHEVAVIKEETP